MIFFVATPGVEPGRAQCSQDFKSGVSHTTIVFTTNTEYMLCTYKSFTFSGY